METIYKDNDTIIPIRYIAYILLITDMNYDY